MIVASALIVLASTSLESPEWRDGLKHFGCAAYLKRTWLLPTSDQGRLSLTAEEALLALESHVEKGAGLLRPIIESIDAQSSEGEMLSRMAVPVSLPSDVVIGAMLGNIMQSNGLEEEITITKRASYLDIAEEALRRYRAQGCADLLEVSQ